MEKNCKFPKSQLGFRRGHSTQEVLAHLIMDIQIGFSEKQSTSALFIDIQGAYDNVNYEILTKKLATIGIPEELISNIYSLYNNRRIFVRTEEGFTDSRIARIGLPQGSILSPILYIIYTHDLELIFNNEVSILQFADDVCIYNTNKSIEEGNNKIREKYDEVNNWFHQNGLTISTEKSAICTFTRKRSVLPSTMIINDTLQIPYKNTIKYLGVLLDKKLLWKDHINYLLKRAENAINIVRVFTHQRWGSDPNIALIFYRSYVRSILDYGCTFYGSAAETHLKKVEQIKNKCLRHCIGFLKSTPIPVLEAETVEPPLLIRRSYLSDKLVLRIISKNSSLLNKIHQVTVLNLTSPYWKHKKSLLCSESYSWITQIKDNIYQSPISPFFQLDENFLKHLPKVVSNKVSELNTYCIKSKFDEQLNTVYANSEHIFTDGSIINNKIGCAFYHKNKNIYKQFKLLENSSIYSAELWAIWESLLYCLEYNDNYNFVIFTDSLSSVQCLKNY